ncbi:hypothetical protein GH714_032359 [Hevea brasiliensis]|uniref:Uncharacterized protein n=1 Tax=Hevea brasiliensis TaxID=3981 RepID=A0A6A6LHP5_HEVBR|nr:hypothetical protein GH714_032359 [Hevea brasiliensis]
MFRMKKAKVSPVYEDRRRKRSREEKDYSSRRARIQAKARKYGHKANVKSHFFVTSSDQSTVSMVEKKKSRQGDDNEEAVAKGKAVMMEKWEGEPEWWEEWPLSWSYEEQWMWYGTSVWDCRPYWEVMSGHDFVNGDDQYQDQKEAWKGGDDDIWNLRVITDVPNP